MHQTEGRRRVTGEDRESKENGEREGKSKTL